MVSPPLCLILWSSRPPLIEEMLERIAQGKLAKFFKESTLLNQEFVKDNKMTIKQYLQSANKELTVTAFKRFTLNL